MPVILTTQEAAIRRITVQSQHRQIVCETLSQKNPSQKKAVGVDQGVGPEFKPQYCQKNKTKKSLMDPREFRRYFCPPFFHNMVFTRNSSSHPFQGEK
jgi:hypothetical protein